MNKEEKKELLKKAVESYGIWPQIDMVVEECSELIHALQKLKRSGGITEEKRFKVCDEIADVKILLEQMENVFPKELIEERVEFKLNRLRERLKESNNL